MARAFNDDLRSRVLAASRDGMSARSAAARFGIGISTAIAWIASARVGQLTPTKQGRRGGSRLDAHEDSALEVRRRKRGWTLDLNPARLVFIDENGLSTKMSRLRGRALAEIDAAHRSRTAIGRQRRLPERSAYPE